MDRALIDGTILEYTVSGDGEPVVFIHGAMIADAFLPLVTEPSLAGRYRLITYHRRGYSGSTHTVGSVSVALQAADCRALLRFLGIERAHVVGHSLGGSIALQLTLDAPETVHSLALLEPALMVGESGPAYRASLAGSIQRYHEVGGATVIDEFLNMRWPGYRTRLDRLLPAAFDQAVADAGSAFESDFGLLDWRFGEVEARRITQPTLSVLGGASDKLSPRFREAHELLLAWLPHAEGFVLPNATHFLQMENPPAMAEALAAFFGRHLISD
jgi:pimeloyl-ACP methyl ester carboxylesterase